MGQRQEESDQVFEMNPAAEIHFDDLGEIHLIGDRVWFPLLEFRPNVHGPDPFIKNICAWCVTSRGIVVPAARRVLMAMGEDVLTNAVGTVRRVIPQRGH